MVNVFRVLNPVVHGLVKVAAGLKPKLVEIEPGTVINIWVPTQQTHDNKKPVLVLVHGFATNGILTWLFQVLSLTRNYSVYVPDLLFFGGSATDRPERSESFQAQCVMKLMDVHGVDKMSLVGISYGGFVGYSMSVQFPAAVERVVLCCAGVCLEEKDMKEGLFKVSDLEEAASILLPQTADKLRELMRFSFVKPIKGVPSYFLSDFIKVSL